MHACFFSHARRITRRAAIAFGLCALPLALCPAWALAPRPEPMSDTDQFLETVQARTFRWFWETTNPRNGLVPDRTPNAPFSSIASVGFGLTAYGVGVERGYITRPQAIERVLTTLRFFANAPMGPETTGVAGHKGLYYHFLNMETGHRHRTNELSTIDTALLMLGVLFCREYFDGPAPEEAEIRALADSLYRRAEWNWVQPRAPLIGMAWRPERGFGAHDYKGMDEAMFLYILAIGSPTHAVAPEAWPAYTSSYMWGTFHGQEYVQFSPLFGYQYSHVWIDPRGLRDAYMREKGIDYFENSRRATYANRAYCIANPGGFNDYSENIWGLTACDGPANATQTIQGRPVRFHTYSARGASLKRINDDGTIAPTAAGGSIPFAPEITIPALITMRERYGDLVFNQYGFVDAFNPTFEPGFGPVVHGIVDPKHGWFDDNQLGIDQGPILLMIENHRSGFVWKVMKRNPYISRGLSLAGFSQ